MVAPTRAAPGCEAAQAGTPPTFAQLSQGSAGQQAGRENAVTGFAIPPGTVRLRRLRVRDSGSNRVTVWMESLTPQPSRTLNSERPQMAREKKRVPNGTLERYF